MRSKDKLAEFVAGWAQHSHGGGTAFADRVWNPAGLRKMKARAGNGAKHDGPG